MLSRQKMVDLVVTQIFVRLLLLMCTYSILGLGDMAKKLITIYSPILTDIDYQLRYTFSDPGDRLTAS